MLDLLKTAFPKPNIPQKRYIIIFTTLIYFVLKSYVMSTPATWDDDLPDHFRDAAITLYAGYPITLDRSGD